MGNTIISYDSPWAEICDAARSAPWSAQRIERASSLKRAQLTEADFNRLAAIPVLLVAEDELPPHPQNYRQINPSSAQYNEMLAERVSAVQTLVTAAGPEFNRYEDPEQVQDIAGVTTAYAFLSYYNVNHPNSPPIRSGTAANDLSSALPHRLSGDLMPASAVVITNSEFDIRPGIIACAERQLWLPEDDYKLLSDAHELTHLLQLAHEVDKKPLHTATLAERDAENGALHLYQATFGGSRAIAASTIISHMSYHFQLAPQYAFRPELPLHELAHASGDVNAIRLHALFTHIGQPPPRFIVLQAWGHDRHGNLPDGIKSLFGREVDEIGQFANAYGQYRGLKDMLEDTLLGLKQMAVREFDMIPENIRPLARQLADAAAFTNPELMEFDPVKPRLSYHLLPKRNDATLA